MTVSRAWRSGGLPELRARGCGNPGRNRGRAAALSRTSRGRRQASRHQCNLEADGHAVVGYFRVKAAIDNALHDLIGKQHGIPAYDRSGRLVVEGVGNNTLPTFVLHTGLRRLLVISVRIGHRSLLPQSS
jgi:hypothetical protein